MPERYDDVKSFSPIAKLCGEFRTQNEPENEESIEEANNAGGEAYSAAVAGLAVEIGRESVGGDFIFGQRLRAGAGA